MSYQMCLDVDQVATGSGFIHAAIFDFSNHAVAVCRRLLVRKRPRPGACESNRDSHVDMPAAAQHHLVKSQILKVAAIGKLDPLAPIVGLAQSFGDDRSQRKRRSRVAEIPPSAIGTQLRAQYPCGIRQPPAESSVEK